MKTGELLAMPDSANLLAFGEFGGPIGDVANAWSFPSDRKDLKLSNEAPPGTKTSLEIQ